ncbi:hypothetical protein FSP39_024523 [Pinctada imbricata]|uniref:Uncharacterized protein n=1 Tax=Pinctada imbricata TaxID=66713 RepID=A0AA88YJY8_PINIB|nr:hypothetical protein FSP39_024523 [Pinctada imbricata]
MNPAERCMSILNYALQHVALSRTEMTESYERLLKNKSSLNAVRNCASKSPGLRQAFADSMDPVLQLMNERFARMKLKEEPFTVYRGVSDEEIDNALSVVRDVCHAEELSRESSSKDVKGCKDLQGFLKTHSMSTHYSFQIMKCNDEETCSYCTMSPLRMDADMAADLYFLPCPVPNDQHYQNFEELYDTKVTDEHRPSLKTSTEFDDDDVESDRRNRDVFKSGKARDVLYCGECSKPRIVYSNSKLDRAQEEILKQIQENGGYTCGCGVPEDCGLVVRKCLTCASEVEVIYYSGNLKHFLPPCCIYCGDREHLLDDSDEYIEQLYEDYSVIRPLCASCRDKGLDAKTWVKKFFKKRKT